MKDIEDLAKTAVDCGFRIHKGLGPGLLESVYEAILADSLARSGLFVERQTPLPIKEAVRRVANNYGFAPSRLCVNPLPRFST